jgi:hypothetical protein
MNEKSVIKRIVNDIIQRNEMFLDDRLFTRDPFANLDYENDKHMELILNLLMKAGTNEDEEFDAVRLMILSIAGVDSDSTDSRLDSDSTALVLPKIVAVALKKRRGHIAITEETRAQDLIEGEVKVLAFLRQDTAQHFVLHFSGQFYTFRREDIPIGTSDLFFICKQQYERITVTEDMLKGKKTLYYNLKKLGLFGICPASQFQAVLESSSYQYFSIEPSKDQGKHIVASYVLFADYGSDATGKEHCQGPQGELLYDIKPFVPKAIVPQAPTKKRKAPTKSRTTKRQRST